MSWYNVISRNSSYYPKMLCLTDITKFPCQLYYNESNL